MTNKPEKLNINEYDLENLRYICSAEHNILKYLIELAHEKGTEVIFVDK